MMNQFLKWLDTLSQIEKEDWDTVEQYLNEEQDNFVVKLRRDYPLLLEEDIHIILLLRLRVSHRKIARLFHILLASFRTRRYRVKKKMGIQGEYQDRKSVV